VEATREKLVELLELQRIDSAIDLVNHRQRHLPEQAELDALTEALAVIDRAAGEQQLKADDAAARQNKLDREVESVAAKVAAEEAKLYSGNVGSPRELSSIQAEIESLKRRRSTMEDLDLEVMEEREGFETELKKLKEEADRLNSSIAQVTEKRDAALAEIEKELSKLEQQRSAWVQRFDQELLGFYDGLRSSKSGIGAAALTDGACQGCHMKLPAQEVSRIRRSEGLVRCVACGRILVVVS